MSTDPKTKEIISIQHAMLDAMAEHPSLRNLFVRISNIFAQPETWSPDMKTLSILASALRKKHPEVVAMIVPDDGTHKGTPITRERALIVRDMLDERHKQISDKGYDSAHDDTHATGDLARAAAAYALAHIEPKTARDIYPWGEFSAIPPEEKYDGHRTPDNAPDYIAHLVTAGALILAEIERVVRRKKAERS